MDGDAESTSVGIQTTKIAVTISANAIDVAANHDLGFGRTVVIGSSLQTSFVGTSRRKGWRQPKSRLGWRTLRRCAGPAA